MVRESGHWWTGFSSGFSPFSPGLWFWRPCGSLPSGYQQGNRPGLTVFVLELGFCSLLLGNDRGPGVSSLRALHDLLLCAGPGLTSCRGRLLFSAGWTCAPLFQALLFSGPFPGVLEYPPWWFGCGFAVPCLAGPRGRSGSAAARLTRSVSARGCRLGRRPGIWLRPERPRGCRGAIPGSWLPQLGSGRMPPQEFGGNQFVAAVP